MTHRSASNPSTTLPRRRSGSCIAASGGRFILADYFAADDAEEAAFFRELRELKRTEGAAEDALVHFDTPLTREHELALLREAGFPDPEILGNWEATALIRAIR